MLDVVKNNLIFYYKKVLENPYELIKLVEDTDQQCDENSLISKWNEWKTSSEDPYIFGKQKRIGTNTLKEKNDNLVKIYKSLRKPIQEVSSHYGVENKISIGHLSPLSIGKYNTGSFMGPHSDTYSDDSPATISVVLYLNDDYEGGELYFEKQNVKIKPEAGSIIVFPSREPYVHASLEVLNGTKYICPGFWNK